MNGLTMLFGCLQCGSDSLASFSRWATAQSLRTCSHRALGGHQSSRSNVIVVSALAPLPKCGTCLYVVHGGTRQEYPTGLFCSRAAQGSSNTKESTREHSSTSSHLFHPHRDRFGGLAVLRSVWHVCRDTPSRSRKGASNANNPIVRPLGLPSDPPQTTSWHAMGSFACASHALI